MNHNLINKFVLPLAMIVLLAGCNKQTKTPEANTPSEGETATEAATNVSSTSLTDEAKKAAVPFLAKGSASALFFYADWCPACRAFKPTVEEVEAKNSAVKVVRLNVDEQKDLTKAFKITSIPSIFFFDKNGEFVESTTGGLTPEKLQEEFTKISGDVPVNKDDVAATTEEVKTSSEETKPAAEDKKKDILPANNKSN